MLVVTVLGMSGLRVDRLRFDTASLLWVAVWLTSMAGMPVLFRWLGMGMLGAAVYLAVAFAMYYGGLTLVLGHHGSERLIARFGSRRAVWWFEMWLGIAFTHQALAQGILVSASSTRLALDVPMGLTATVGILAVVVSLIVKIWSTHLVGLDAYYYVDMFLQRKQAMHPTRQALVARGPYRWLNNPMYGVGNLCAYGMALIKHSWLGLIASAAAQICIYTFYFRHERPFVRRHYLAHPV